MASPSLRTSTTRAESAAQVERPGVVGLSAAGGVEGGPVEGDPVVVHRGDRGVEGPQLGVAQVQQVGGHRRQSAPTTGPVHCTETQPRV